MKKLVTLIALAFFLVPIQTSASTLTTNQIGAIAGLLRAFGASEVLVLQVIQQLSTTMPKPTTAPVAPISAPSAAIQPIANTVPTPTEKVVEVTPDPTCKLSLRWTGDESDPGVRGLEVTWASTNATKMEGINGPSNGSKLDVAGGSMTFSENVNGRTFVEKYAVFINEKTGKQVRCTATLKV